MSWSNVATKSSIVLDPQPPVSDADEDERRFDDEPEACGVAFGLEEYEADGDEAFVAGPE